MKILFFLPIVYMGDKPGPYPRPGGPGTGTGKCGEGAIALSFLIF